MVRLGKNNYTNARVTSPNATFTYFLTKTATNPNGTPYCETASGCTAPILNVPKETATLAAVYTTKVLNGYQLTAALADSYVGPAYDEAYHFGFRLSSYSIANARLGLSTDRWAGNLFIDNFTNKMAGITANYTGFQFQQPGVDALYEQSAAHLRHAGEL